MDRYTALWVGLVIGVAAFAVTHTTPRWIGRWDIERTAEAEQKGFVDGMMMGVEWIPTPPDYEKPSSDGDLTMGGGAVDVELKEWAVAPEEARAAVGGECVTYGDGYTITEGVWDTEPTICDDISMHGDWDVGSLILRDCEAPGHWRLDVDKDGQVVARRVRGVEASDIARQAEGVKDRLEGGMVP